MMSMCKLSGYHLIALIRSWQNIFNELMAPKGLHAFRFNTYIISVLVIFFLQVNYNLPKLAHLPSSGIEFIDHLPKFNKNDLKRAIVQFFEFYGKIYALEDVISVHNGRWVDRGQNRFACIITQIFALCIFSMNIYFI